MQNDKTTLRDLSVFPIDGSAGVFDLIDRTATQAGKEALRAHVLTPPASFEALVAMQHAIKFLGDNVQKWPSVITNGTLVMLEKYFEASDNTMPPPAGIAGVLTRALQKTLFKRDYFYTKFSLSHLSDFFRGCRQLTEIEGAPGLLSENLQAIKKEMEHPLVAPIAAITDQTSFSELLQLQYKARRDLKHMVYRLIRIYAQLDAWYAMAAAGKEHGWVFPTLLPELPVQMQATQIFHPLLSQPTSYDLSFSEGKNFLLLTGANMSGKTTFLRSLGVGALLAHLGMAVPAEAFTTSFIHGIITNMHAEDSIQKGESYFFAEVQRMKQIAARIGTEKPHLALMDELFKGTNVHDAFDCTRAVVTGLTGHPNHLMALSTHLYEVAQQFEADPRIRFSYFETHINTDGDYMFTYRLKDGISNDRIGYLILQQEGIIAMLNKKH
jgi:DNA mismatch repair protein MutS